MNHNDELGRAYRALQAFYRLSIEGTKPTQAMLAQHTAALQAAIRFTEEETSAPPRTLTIINGRSQ